jgi:hypothetical protein
MDSLICEKKLLLNTGRKMNAKGHLDEIIEQCHMATPKAALEVLYDEAYDRGHAQGKDTVKEPPARSEFRLCTA